MQGKSLGSSLSRARQIDPKSKNYNQESLALKSLILKEFYQCKVNLSDQV